MPLPLDELQQCIETGRCVVLVGTGVSSASSGDPRASWPGLLRSGARYAENYRNADADWVADCDTRLSGAPTSTELLLVAEEVVEALGGASSPEFKAWLRQDIGYLKLREAELPRAIGELRCPIVTTNYDDLLENALNRSAVSWTDSGGFQRLLTQQDGDIGHLHGHWSQPESIVLTADQYKLMMEDRQAQTLRTAMISVNSVLYVGFGAGISDPNFSNLRSWTAVNLPNQEIHHFRLCRDAERAELMQEHLQSDDRIIPISYGAHYDDLAPFLRSLVPAPRAESSRPTGISGLQLIEERVRETAVLAPHVRDLEVARVTDLLIPPVLLPIPQDQYAAAARESGPAVRQQRCDMAAEIAAGNILVAGEEHVGLSSALAWLATEACTQNSELTPVIVDYQKIGAGLRPLRREVLRQLRSMGRTLSNEDDFPKMVLVIDNTAITTKARWDRVIQELADESFERIFVGCRTTAEAEIAAELNAAGFEFRTRFMGRLAKADARGLVALVTTRPDRVDEYTSRVATLVRAHHLPSTPFTVSMILSAMLRGEALLAATSPTTLLDAYVDLLLGRGSVEEDSRFGLDSFGRTYTLSGLAEVFVHERTGALPQSVVVATLAKLFDALDWVDSPIDVLRDLQQRHVLVIRGGDVSFSQSSYLHLFAAKRALAEPVFLQTLLDEPLYFAPILSHYAALSRSDVALVQKVVPILERFAVLHADSAHVFNPVGSSEQPSKEIVRSTLSDEVRVVTATDPSDDDLEPLDQLEEDDRVPFPLQPVAELTTIGAHLTALGLASNVLRDTEVFPDQDDRELLLRTILTSWALVVARMELDVRDNPLIREALIDSFKDSGISRRKFGAFIDEVVRLIPLAMALGGITATLTSIKLSRSVRRILDTTADDGALQFLGVYLLFDCKADDWSSRLDGLQTTWGKSEAVAVFMRRLALMAFMHGGLNRSDESRVITFLLDQAAASGDNSSRRRDELKQQLMQAKLQTSTRQLLRGDDAE